MTSSTDLKCWLCGDGLASQVVEAKNPAHTETRLSCDSVLCLELSAIWADGWGREHADTRTLTAAAICVDGLIAFYTEDGPEYWACHGCPGCEEPR